ncbi:LPXTG cell wall anchor domain-containing protein, partial [Streptococcus ovuberis]
EKGKVSEAVKKANPDFPEGTTVEVGNDGTVTVTYPDKSKDTITSDKTVTPKPSQTMQPGNDKGNRKTVSPSGSSEQSSKQLPKTGDSSEVTSLVAGFGLLALIAVMTKRRRKED